MKLLIEIDFEEVPFDEVIEWLPELRDKAIEMGKITKSVLTGVPEMQPLGWATAAEED